MVGVIMVSLSELSRRERGDASVIVLIIIVLLLIGGAGYWLWHQKHSKGVAVIQPAILGTCQHLSLSQGSSSGAAGTIYKNAVITNTGTDTCTVTGYPGVFMIDSGGTQVGSGAAANSLYAAATVTLVPGGKAHSVVAFPQQGNFNPGTCSAIGSSMKMYVPGLATPLTAAWSDYSCPGFSATAIQPGASS